MELNSFEVARERDADIIDLLSRFKFLNTKHLEFLLPWSYKACIRRLTKLANQRVVKRWRPHKSATYIYYLGQRSENINHWLLMASAYCYLKKRYGIKHWECEVPFSMLRPDGYTRELNAFVEIDLATNPFDKVNLYHRLYESNEWIGETTPKKGEAYWFPRIIVVTPRKKNLMDRIAEENSMGLDFILLEKQLVESEWV